MARFRVLRILKINVFWDTFERLDQRLNAGYAVRLARTLIYMIFIIHVETCGYYAFNRWQGLNATSWSIPTEKISPYVYSFYVCMKTATSIGSLPAATYGYEFVFMTTYWLSGIFVSAILIGQMISILRVHQNLRVKFNRYLNTFWLFQIIDILDTANANKVNYRRIMDSTLSCMHHLRAPEQVTNKVRTWFLYNWDQQKTFDENSLFESLPIKLKSDLAISVHFHTLNKVSLFQGEVGKEMYIVKSGIVEVVGGPNNSIVFVALKEGSVFGEISLLALSGKNRRTADVRSKGFSTLFSLSKQDFEEIMRNYPQAHHLLKKRSQRMLNRDKRKVKEEEKMRKEKEQTEIDADGLTAEEVVEVIAERPLTPKLMNTVVQALEASCLDKAMVQQLRRRSVRSPAELRRLSMLEYSLNASMFAKMQSMQQQHNRVRSAHQLETQSAGIPGASCDEKSPQSTGTSETPSSEVIEEATSAADVLHDVNEGNQDQEEEEEENEGIEESAMQSEGWIRRLQVPRRHLRWHR